MTIIDPFLDGKPSWQGDTLGTMRKRFSCFGSQMSGAQHSLDFCSNVTIYSPGEGSVFHNHPGSEELSYVISGTGVLQDMEQNVTGQLQPGRLLLVERGEIHRIYNNGSQPLIVLLVCTAQTPMPEG